MPRRILIDTDPGVDDTAAILLALASPELSVEALTIVFGNGNAQDCTRNALTVLETAKREDIPVFTGANRPLMRDTNYGYDVHGSNAFGGIIFDSPRLRPQAEYAASAIINTIMSHPGEITLVAQGPLTNVALALLLEPRLAKSMKELVLMGGAILTFGNRSPAASANHFNDPEAAAIVYQSGASITQVGLDVCRKIVYTTDEFSQVERAHLPTTALLAKITPHIAQFYQRRKTFPADGYVSYNDVPVIAYLIAPELFDAQQYYVQISTCDEITRGETVADIMDIYKQPPNAKVLMDVNAAALKRLFLERVTRYRN
jgi:inosine-uridine nucleoside N-ribohydrolase